MLPDPDADPGMPGVQDTQALDSFLDKWRTRWPEWRVAEAFIPAAQRDRAVAWAVLLQEFEDAAWEGEQAAPGLAKLAWWQDELAGWAKGARRHPLGSLLQPVAAPWAALGQALNALPATREQPADAMRAGLAPLARAIAGCERALAGNPPTDAHAPDAQSALACLVGARVLRNGQGDAADALARQWPAPPVARAARLRAGLMRARLLRLVKGGAQTPLPAWRALLVSWQAARGR